jgi:hypothetical protein
VPVGRPGGIKVSEQAAKLMTAAISSRMLKALSTGGAHVILNKRFR